MSHEPTKEREGTMTTILLGLWTSLICVIVCAVMAIMAGRGKCQ